MIAASRDVRAVYWGTPRGLGLSQYNEKGRGRRLIIEIAGGGQRAYRDAIHREGVKQKPCSVAAAGAENKRCADWCQHIEEQITQRGRVRIKPTEVSPRLATLPG